MMRLSIRMRLTLWNASVLALVLGTFAFAGWITLTGTLNQRSDSAVRESARVVAGATREEIAEVVFIAAALRAGAAVGHGLLALRLFDEATGKAEAR